MAAYFSNIPNFRYTNRRANQGSSSSYITVKNLFKRARLREDIFGNLNFFDKYEITGDQRPDNVAYEIYDDETLDWIVLLSNNIIDVRNEWPLTQDEFDAQMLEKYDDYETFYQGIHHYITEEVRDSAGKIIIKSGLEVPEKIIDNRQYLIGDPNPNPTYLQLVNYYVEYYDSELGIQTFAQNITVPVTNFEYEIELENRKRSIFILKPQYLNIVFNDLEEIMPYKRGSTQYVNRTLKQGDNIKLFE